MRQTQPTGSHRLEGSREGKGSPLLTPCCSCSPSCRLLQALQCPVCLLTAHQRLWAFCNFLDPGSKKKGRRRKQGGEKPSSASRGSFTFPRLSRSSASEQSQGSDSQPVTTSSETTAGCSPGRPSALTFSKHQTNSGSNHAIKNAQPQSLLPSFPTNMGTPSCATLGPDTKPKSS